MKTMKNNINTMRNVKAENDTRLYDQIITKIINNIDNLLTDNVDLLLTTSFTINSNLLVENWAIIYSDDIRKHRIHVENSEDFKSKKSQELTNICFVRIVQTLQQNGFKIEYNEKRYQEILTSENIEKTFKITLKW